MLEQNPTTVFNCDSSTRKNASFVDHINVLSKRKKFVAIFTCGFAVLSAIISIVLPNIYVAKSLILPVEDDRGMTSVMMSQLGGLASLAGGSLGGTTKTELYVTMLKSDTIKDSIIDRFKLLDVYKVKFRHDAYTALDKKAVIIGGKKDGVIVIKVEDKNAVRAAEIANAYVDELGKMAARINMTGAGKNRVFLEERLAGAKSDLAKAEESLKEFQTQNKTVSVTDQAKATIEGVAQLRAQLAFQEVQLGALQRQFTDSSQEVKTLKSSIGNLRGQIARLEGNGAGSSIPSVGSVPQLGQEYIRLMRQMKIQETLVELLTKQYEMARLSEVKDVAPFQVIQRAKAPDKRTKPSRTKTVAITFVVAFFSSVVGAFLLEAWQQKANHDKEKLRHALKNFFRAAPIE